MADPAVGTGTFLLGVLRRIAATVEADEGAGAVTGAIDAAIKRLIAFEMQLGPFAVAQLRIYAELLDLIGRPPTTPPRMFVTDTLGSPYIEQGWLPRHLRAHRRIPQASQQDQVQRTDHGRDRQSALQGKGQGPRRLDRERGHGMRRASPRSTPGCRRAIGASARTPSICATSTFTSGAGRLGRCSITTPRPTRASSASSPWPVSSTGPGFQKMRDYLRRTADAIWVIDCSPEGHQPEVNTRIFQGVQQPVCIVLVSRSAKSDPNTPATVRYHALAKGRREEKFGARRSSARMATPGPIARPIGVPRSCPPPPALGHLSGARRPLRLQRLRRHARPNLGHRPRCRVAAAALAELIKAKAEQKEELFRPASRRRKAGRQAQSIEWWRRGCPVSRRSDKPIADDRGDCVPPMRYGFRSFDRQWIIPDNRVINRPNPELWRAHSDEQVYLTALQRTFAD